MRTLIHRLSFAWLVLALITVPVQAADLSLDTVPVPDCEMHSSDNPDDAAQAESHCPACIDHGCECAGCNGQGCSTSNIQLSVIDAQGHWPTPAAARLLPHADRALTSLTLPPLDRPPAV